MKKDVIISIKGLYTDEDDNDSLELQTVGSYHRPKDGGSYYIRYKETAATGYEGCTTTLRVDGSECVTIQRTGAQSSSLVIERNRRHLCQYDTGFGAFTVGVYSDAIESSLDDSGGRLHFRYSLDINASHASSNDVTVSVREAGKPIN